MRLSAKEKALCYLRLTHHVMSSTDILSCHSLLLLIIAQETPLHPCNKLEWLCSNNHLLNVLFLVGGWGLFSISKTIWLICLRLQCSYLLADVTVFAWCFKPFWTSKCLFVSRFLVFLLVTSLVEMDSDLKFVWYSGVAAVETSLCRQI